ncbi:hypothetical protein [Pedobacter steynii]
MKTRELLLAYIIIFLCISSCNIDSNQRSENITEAVVTPTPVVHDTVYVYLPAERTKAATKDTLIKTSELSYEEIFNKVNAESKASIPFGNADLFTTKYLDYDANKKNSVQSIYLLK